MRKDKCVLVDRYLEIESSIVIGLNVCAIRINLVIGLYSLLYKDLKRSFVFIANKKRTRKRLFASGLL